MHRRDDVVDTLRQRLISGLHLGTLRAGARLPSARRLATELDADPRVVLNAYRRLEREGLVERRNGARGFFAAQLRGLTGRPAPSAEWMIDILERAIAHGVFAPHFPEHARRSLETVRLRAACIECNTDQLEWICGELHDDYGIESASVEIGDLGTVDQPHPAIRRADIVVTTVQHTSEVRRLAKRLDKPFVIVTLPREITDELQRLLRAGPVYFVCADVRYAEKLKKLYAGTAGAKHVCPVVLGWHDPATIPAGAPTWMLRSARDRLGGVPAHVHALPTLRLFSSDTRRSLLSFVVRSNLAAADALARREA